MDLPNPNWLERYEKLGIVGILLLILLMMLILFSFVMRRASSAGTKFLEFVSKQTEALTEVRDSNVKLNEDVSVYHSRIDRILECSAHECPVRKIRQQSAPGPHPVFPSIRHESDAPAT